MITKTNHIITLTKEQLRDHVKNTVVSYGFSKIHGHTLFICATNRGIINAIFCEPNDQKTIEAILNHYPLKKACDEQELKQFLQNPTFLLAGTPFQQRIWQELMTIPMGTLTTYHTIAQKINREKAHRAVANAIGANPIAYFIPCHRVIRKDNSLGGYRWGIQIKQRLLELEIQ